MAMPYPTLSERFWTFGGINMTRIFNNQVIGKQRGILLCLLILFLPLCAPAAQAQTQTRLIVRDSLGLPGVNLTCVLLGCNVVQGLGVPQGRLFLVTFPSILNPIVAVLQLNLQLGIVDVELDQHIASYDSNAGATPSYLTDKTPTAYYGATVWQGYLIQPGNQLVRTSMTQSKFSVTG